MSDHVRSSAMRRNMELKVRLADLAAARRVAESLATSRLGLLRQIDTYFTCATGRLKLREIDGHAAELIWYARPDEAAPKGSDYLIVPVADPGALKAALAGALGVRAVVDKRREVYLVDNVRIHLDDVAGLGSFLEFEAVLDPGVSDSQGREQLARLSAAFGLKAGDLLAGSYGDLAASDGTFHSADGPPRSIVERAGDR
jgi:predicted adenylyl cyclase CyaB